MTQKLSPRLRSNWKYLIILLSLSLVYVFLYVLGILFIQFIMFFASAALFPALLVHEKDNMRKQDLTRDLSADERWSKTKSVIEKITDRIEKSRNNSEKKALQVQKLSLESELRRLEWEVKESDMTQMYNASRGKLRRLDDPRSVTGEISPSDPKGKSKRESRDFLLNTIRNAEKILSTEPLSSVREALTPITNDLRAHHNILKKGKDIDSEILSDYFVAWGTLSSFLKGAPLDRKLIKYASTDFRPKLKKLQTSIESLNELTKEPIKNSSRNESATI